MLTGCPVVFLQAQARKHLGQDVTVFERVHDGLQTIRKGDVVKLSTKPTILGRVSANCANTL